MEQHTWHLVWRKIEEWIGMKIGILIQLIGDFVDLVYRTLTQKLNGNGDRSSRPTFHH